MMSYLQRRGIFADAIARCMDANILYEGRYEGKAVCVFVGRDERGTARFGCMPGIASDLKRDCAGSDKRFSFSIKAKDSTRGDMAVFESPIDAISHLCLYPDWEGHRLSLGGTSDIALMAFLGRHPNTEHISFCLDVDDAGQQAVQRIADTLGSDTRFSHITISIKPPDVGKDYNDALLSVTKQKRENMQVGHQKEAGPSF
jgi:hypothetical protein